MQTCSTSRHGGVGGGWGAGERVGKQLSKTDLRNVSLRTRRRPRKIKFGENLSGSPYSFLRKHP